MCGTEYGGGEGGERRYLGDNDLAGPLPTEMRNLVAIRSLCVRPAPPPHLANAGLAAPRGRLAGVGEQVHGCLRGGVCMLGAFCGLRPEKRLRVRRCARSYVDDTAGLTGYKIPVGEVGCGYSTYRTGITGPCPPR